jgi:Uma2 family endonuclease
MAIDTRVQARNQPRFTVPTEPIWRLDVAQYHAMIQAGILTDDDPIELLEGWLVTTMPKNPPHRLSTQLTREALAGLLPPGWYADDQEPITTEDSEPEPDVSVVRGERRAFRDRHPGPADVALVVEVADTTLQRDRTTKKRLYARAGIPAYWIINLGERQIEVYTSPSNSGDEPSYAQKVIFGEEDTLPVLLDRHEIGVVAVRDLLP